MKKLPIYGLFLSALVLVLLTECKKEDVKVIPIVEEATISNITASTASCASEVTSDGGAMIIARGVCWSSESDPEITDKKTFDGTGRGVFTSSVTGLNPGVTYKLRAYATNSVGVAYSETTTFTTPTILPVLTTEALTNITSTAVTSGGTITNDGGGAITARGLCWSTSQNPTISDSKTSDGTSAGSFTSSVTGLAPGVVYYFRAYATNSAGTGYGNQVTCTTQAVVATLTTTTISAVQATSAVSGGAITTDGGSPVTARGVCWSLNQNPTVTDSKTSDGTGAGYFTSNLTALSPGKTYYVRAYATNSVGTAYGNQLTVSTPAVTATVTTTAASLVTPNSLRSGGNVANDGGAAVSARGVCWSTSQNPTVSNSKTTEGTGTGIFASQLTGLSPATTYYLRAYATNSAGTGYGDQITVTTLAAAPTVTTSAVSSITNASATSGGTAASDASAPITSRGICWSTSHNPTIDDKKTSDGTGSGTFTSNLTALNPDVTYYVRAYATNSTGTGYGNEVSFKSGSLIVTDVDGNQYHTVTIGDQVWMVENLRTTKFRNGDAVPKATGNSNWGIESPQYCNIDYNDANAPVYGLMYNWYVVKDSRKIAPEGWHVPSKSEWMTLVDYLGGSSAAGGKLKETGTSHWTSPNTGATNETGFTALPTGEHQCCTFEYRWTAAYFWTSTVYEVYSTNAYSYYISNYNNICYTGPMTMVLWAGYTIRCIRD